MISELCLVTGVAGFIGSTLSRRLVDEGFGVLGIDCLTDHYSAQTKETNLLALKPHPDFELIDQDLAEF